MAGSVPQTSVVQKYTSFGNERPKFESALPLYEAERATTGSVFRDVLCADLAMDLAVAQPFQRDQWMSRYRSHLRDAVHIGQYWMERGRGGPDSTLHAHIAAAALRLVDAPLWDSALAGKPTGFDYEEIVLGMAEVYDVVDSEAKGVEDVMAEGLLKLAGARQQRAFGRHANLREDEQITLHLVAKPSLTGETALKAVKRNPRWDCSLWGSPNPEDIKNPKSPAQKQVKRGHFPAGTALSANAYREAKVQPVSTGMLGWYSPRLVIASCLADFEKPGGALMDGFSTKDLMSRDELDDNFGCALIYLLDTPLEEPQRPWQEYRAA